MPLLRLRPAEKTEKRERAAVEPGEQVRAIEALHKLAEPKELVIAGDRARVLRLRGAQWSRASWAKLTAVA